MKGKQGVAKEKKGEERRRKEKKGEERRGRHFSPGLVVTMDESTLRPPPIENKINRTNQNTDIFGYLYL